MTPSISNMIADDVFYCAMISSILAQYWAFIFQHTSAAGGRVSGHRRVSDKLTQAVGWRAERLAGSQEPQVRAARISGSRPGKTPVM
jgi:hypothetical protein